uniref:ATP synthase complex subunit 8 n=1 Tax=Allobates aff. trilineatus 1 AR-2020 TaxID=2739732 RepID=A0A7M3USV2_9NEOB|nr:ATP synthase F0 subunit 8 [Allobates aff. trilineatus 1 AR-2020]
MPQLAPQPWFFILFTTWMVILFFATSKTSKFTFLNDPSNLTFKNTNTPWPWQWL